MHKERLHLLILLLIFLMNIILIQFPLGRLIIFPFVVLSTWFHEIGHSLAAIMVGGSVIKIEIFADGSGVAYHTLPLHSTNLKSALVALSGPIFPPIVGYFLISFSNNLKLVKLFLLIISFSIFISLILWIRNLFGFLFLLVISIFFALVALGKNENFSIITSQTIGIQAFLSVYLSMGYLFSKSGIVNQSSFASDTEIVAQNLFLPNWFWGSLIIVFTLIMLFLSFKKALKNQ
mgnify:CR=1 FL=1